MKTLALAAVLLALAAPARADWRPDAWITAKVKIAILTLPTPGVSEVDVDTVDGKVTLHGSVPTAEDRAAVEKAAKGIQGVASVSDLVAVVSPKRKKAVEASDDSIRGKVEAALAKDAARSSSAITVESVHDGLVLLAGTAPSSVEHLRALQLARRVRGVRGVATEVRTPANDAALDVWSGTELRSEGSSLADVSSDLWTTAAVRLSLLADEEVPASDVSVDTRSGVVTLFGSVATKDQKEDAEDTAEDVDGVRDVRNLLQVVPAEKSAQVKATDEELAGKVNEAIYARPEMRGASIDVAVRNRVVRLSGSVPAAQHRVSAALAARRVPGVRSVEEDLTVVGITKTVETEEK